MILIDKYGKAALTTVQYYVRSPNVNTISVANILDYGAIANGADNVHNALSAAISDGISDVIHLPRGSYLLSTDITIPSDKKLTFSRNARLIISENTTLTIDGTWEAGDDDWIFDLSLGGKVGGNYKLDSIRPEWVGAKGDYYSDDTDAFKYAMSLCDRKRRLLLGPRHYTIKDTIENLSRGISGVSKYVDGGSGGTRINYDPPAGSSDLLPCIRIKDAGASAVFEDFRIVGRVAYASRKLSEWVDKNLFEMSHYDMFAPGFVGIEVAGSATPIFRGVSTAGVKVGILFNSDKGHISSYDCEWNGLIGVYCRKNSEDYFFQGGGISGSFAGIMFGVIPIAGHNGGMTATTLTRVHMGFAPYGIYQVIDVDMTTYESFSSVAGLNGHIEGRFEQTGEAAIKLLPKSDTSGLTITGFGMGFSAIDYTDEPGRWQYSMPDELILPEEKQKYAVWLGGLRNSRILKDRGTAVKSKALGALGSAYIETLHDNIDLSGLDLENVRYSRKMAGTSLRYSIPNVLDESIREYANSAISHGNLFEPEDVSYWTSTNSATISIVTPDLVPNMTEELLRHVGSAAKVIKVTPDGLRSPTISIRPPEERRIVSTSRMINYEYFIHAPSGVVASRMEFGGGKFLYSNTRTNLTGWTRITGREEYAPNENLNQISIFQASATDPTYIVGLMVSYDGLASYSPYLHAYTRMPIETPAGLILTDEITGSRYKLSVIEGSLSLSTIK